MCAHKPFGGKPPAHFGLEGECAQFACARKVVECRVVDGQRHAPILVDVHFHGYVGDEHSPSYGICFQVKSACPFSVVSRLRVGDVNRRYADSRQVVVCRRQCDFSIGYRFGCRNLCLRAPHRWKHVAVQCLVCLLPLNLESAAVCPSSGKILDYGGVGVQHAVNLVVARLLRCADFCFQHVPWNRRRQSHHQRVGNVNARTDVLLQCVGAGFAKLLVFLSQVLRARHSR